MQSQSPGVVAFRALVMLSCLVAIPLAAVFGSALPDLLKGLLDGNLPYGNLPWNTAISQEPASQTGQPAPGTAGFASANMAPPQVSLGEEAISKGAPSPTAFGERGHAVEPTAAWDQGTIDPAPASAVVPVAYETPIGPPSPKPGVHGAPRELHPSVPSVAIAMQPVTSGPKPLGNEAISSPVNAAAPHVDRFTQTQNRLQELGATYYLLETLGTQGLYRFYCRMAIGGNPTFIKWFEATDPEPLTAMAKVLDQVETWHAGRLP